MKNQTKNKSYKFKLLREKVVDTDIFEDNTHENIAEALYKLIRSEKNGISIGLEGPWGSGKSTVISILRKKILDGHPSIRLIQFDSWAHEGDPLRRIFLESIIEGINPKAGSKLDDLKNEISHRKKKISTTITHSTTGLGKCLAITSFFVPMGVAFLTKVDYSILSPYWLLILGLMLSGAPLLVIFGNLIRILWAVKLGKKKICSSEHWSFLQDKTDKEINQEISEEDERSSIEFEKYFNQIMEQSFKCDEIDKIIIVVDNLDRIDKHDSLKIWSTLQTFLQQRNQQNKQNNWFDKLWVIVPYDSDGLSNLWDNGKNNGSSNPQNDERNNDTSKSFFDKCFQLRMEVPKLILSSWENFAKTMINKALTDWDKSDKDEIVKILRITRKSINDIPTPREIKNYINQVGFLASQWGAEISISSIAYYVCWRELKHKPVNHIREKLVERGLIDEKHMSLLPESIIKELAGLIFGVSPVKGEQLLLVPEITQALDNSDGDKLSKLCDTHGNGFWSVFNFHIEQSSFEHNIKALLNPAQAIYKGVWEDNSVKAMGFVNKIVRQDLINIDIVNFDWSDDHIEQYICLLNICSKHPKFVRNVYQFLIKGLKKTFSKEENLEWNQIITNFSKLIGIISNIIEMPQRQTIDELTLSRLLPWAESSASLNIETSDWIAPPKKIVVEIAEAIQAGQPLPNGIYSAIQYSIKAELTDDWEPTLKECHAYIIWNNGAYSNQSDEIFDIINIFAFKINNSIEIIQTIIQTGHYHSLFSQSQVQNQLKAALVCGFIFGKELQSTAIPVVGQSENGLTLIKNTWQTSNAEIAQKLFSEIVKYNIWSFLWELAEDDNNKLVGDIILLALEDNDETELFKVNSALNKLNYYVKLTEESNDENDKISKLINKFIIYAGLEKEIIEMDDINIVEYNFLLYRILEQTENKEIISKIVQNLRNVNKDIWDDAFNNDSYLTSLVLEIKNKDNNFYLDNNYTDAIIQFVNKSQDNQKNYTDWQKENWQALVAVMGDNFRIHFKEKITEYFCNNLHSISIDSFKINKDYYLYEKIIKNSEKIEKAFEKFIKSRDIERLTLLNQILAKDNKKKFKPAKHFPDIMKIPLRDLYNGQDNNENKELIKQLATKFKISLIENNVELSKEVSGK